MLRVAIAIDTAIAIVLCGTGIYHFTQPHAAWRSGTIEVVSAASLIIAAYFIDRTKAVLVHVAVLATIFGLSIRHLIDRGWRSGITELFLSIILVAVAAAIYRYKPGKSQGS